MNVDIRLGYILFYFYFYATDHTCNKFFCSIYLLVLYLPPPATLTWGISCSLSLLKVRNLSHEIQETSFQIFLWKREQKIVQWASMQVWISYLPLQCLLICPRKFWPRNDNHTRWQIWCCRLTRCLSFMNGKYLTML